MKDRIHCFILDNRIRHNIRKSYRKEFFIMSSILLITKRNLKCHTLILLNSQEELQRHIAKCFLKDVQYMPLA